MIKQTILLIVALFLLGLFVSTTVNGQSFTPADTCHSNAVSLITSNSARLTTNTGNGDVLGTIVVLKYVRVGQTDTVTSSAAYPNGLRNLTGLQSATQYVYYWAFSNGAEWVPQLGRYYFTALANTISYTPQFNNYQYPYIKFDSGMKVPRHDTLLYRAPNTSGGDIVFKSPNFYGYNGTSWQQFGSITGVSNKVDSVTVYGDSLFYWINGVSYGYILPANSNDWQLDGNSGTTPGTDFIGTTDNVDLVFKRNSLLSGRIGESTSFGISALSSNTSGTENTGIGNSALQANEDGGGNTAIGNSSMSSNVDGEANTAVGGNSLEANISGISNTAIGTGSLGVATGSRNIGIGASAGTSLTSQSNRLIINSLSRGSLLLDTTASIIYGTQDATAANQRLYLNSRVYIPHQLGIGTGTVTSPWKLQVNGEVVLQTALGAGFSTSEADGGRWATAMGMWNGDGNGTVLHIDDSTGNNYFVNNALDARLGINKSGPTVALDVVGDIAVTGAVKFTGLISQYNAADSMVVINPADGKLGYRAIPTGGASGLTIGTTTITSGTNTRVLYNNSGALGEYSVTGTGNVMMSASPTTTGTLTGAAANFTGQVQAINNGAALVLKKSSGSVGSLYLDYQRADGTEKGYFGYGGGADDNFYIAQLEAAPMMLYNGGIAMQINPSMNIAIGNTNDTYKVDVTGTVNATTLKTTPVAYGSLPTGVTGMIATINDSNTIVWGATIAGGGANIVLGFFNGTNWTVIGK